MKNIIALLFWMMGSVCTAETLRNSDNDHEGDLQTGSLAVRWSDGSVIAKDVVGNKGEITRDLANFEGANVKLSRWDQGAAIWRRATFTKSEINFDLYHYESGSTVGVGANSESLSPSKKYVFLQRAVFGRLINSGGIVHTEKSYCDMVSMDTGCVLLSRPAESCSGSWRGDEWFTDDGEIILPKLETVSPSVLLKLVNATSDPKPRAIAIKEQLFMGPESYVSCFPAAKNIQTLNDLGFYLAEAGDDSSALKIYRSIEMIGKRTVLMVNIADSLWRLGETSEAIKYYRKYSDAMVSEGKAIKIPARVYARMK